jgi:hypothetical protein
LYRYQFPDGTLTGKESSLKLKVLLKPRVCGIHPHPSTDRTPRQVSELCSKGLWPVDVLTHRVKSYLQGVFVALTHYRVEDARVNDYEDGWQQDMQQQDTDE